MKKGMKGRVCIHRKNKNLFLTNYIDYKKSVIYILYTAIGNKHT